MSHTACTPGAGRRLAGLAFPMSSDVHISSTCSVITSFVQHSRRRAGPPGGGGLTALQREPDCRHLPPMQRWRHCAAWQQLTQALILKANASSTWKPASQAENSHPCSILPSSPVRPRAPACLAASLSLAGFGCRPPPSGSLVWLQGHACSVNAAQLVHSQSKRCEGGQSDGNDTPDGDSCSLSAWCWGRASA